MRLGSYDVSGHSEWFGYGKVNARNAVRAAQQSLSATSVVREVTGKNRNRLTIPDNDRQGMKSLIVITDSSLVKNIEVSISITHDFLGDLEIYLISPNNQRVLLQSRTLGCRQELQANYTQILAPHLAQLIDIPANGRWFLWVIDYAPQDVGTLNNWELKLGI